jgi:hypothetical protein
MPRPYLYLVYEVYRALHIHLMATTSDPMRWRGSGAEHVRWRRSAVRWAWGAREILHRHVREILHRPSASLLTLRAV